MVALLIPNLVTRWRCSASRPCRLTVGKGTLIPAERVAEPVRTVFR